MFSEKVTAIQTEPRPPRVAVGLLCEAFGKMQVEGLVALGLFVYIRRGRGDDASKPRSARRKFIASSSVQLRHESILRQKWRTGRPGSIAQSGFFIILYDIFGRLVAMLGSKRIAAT